jgi:hypothetical protein
MITIRSAAKLIEATNPVYEVDSLYSSLVLGNTNIDFTNEVKAEYGLRVHLLLSDFVGLGIAPSAGIKALLHAAIYANLIDPSLKNPARALDYGRLHAFFYSHINSPVPQAPLMMTCAHTYYTYSMGLPNTERKIPHLVAASFPWYTEIINTNVE